MEKIDKNRFQWVGPNAEESEGMARPSVTYWRDAMGRLKTRWPWFAPLSSSC